MRGIAIILLILTLGFIDKILAKQCDFPKEYKAVKAAEEAFYKVEIKKIYCEIIGN